MTTLDVEHNDVDRQEILKAIIECIPLLEKIADRFELLKQLPEPQRMALLTAAGELVKFGIHINAVDTGWVTDEDPVILARQKQERHDFQPPLDIVDGAARVCDPFFHGIITGKQWSGKFLKDYFPIDW